MKQLNEIDVDALIVQDMGAVEIIKDCSGYDFARKHADGLLQVLGCNLEVIRIFRWFWRELSEKEIEHICEMQKRKLKFLFTI